MIDLSHYINDSKKEGFCLLHSGTKGKTIVGANGKRVKNYKNLKIKNCNIGYIAYPNPTLKNNIPNSRFYEFENVKIITPERRRHRSMSPSGNLNINYNTSGPLQTSVTKKQYIRKIKHIKELLAAGEIYQMCYCIRFRKKFSGDPYGLFLKLSETNPANFSAYLNCGDFQILSASPERLFEVKNGVIRTQPIKGTISKAEGATPASRLLGSKKDRAELDMITDLERNDIGKICEYGTLKLTKERELMELPNLWHTYSEVQGKLRSDVGPNEIIKAMFPGGSITGCPKIRAMKYIEESEGLPRNIFTGSIGWISNRKTNWTSNGNRIEQSAINSKPIRNQFGMDMNIAIRTALVKDGYIEYWAGGGIVADSDPESEYEECMLKAEKFLGLI